MLRSFFQAEIRKKAEKSPETASFRARDAPETPSSRGARDFFANTPKKTAFHG
jgi:hypothetical protein